LALTIELTELWILDRREWTDDLLIIDGEVAAEMGLISIGSFPIILLGDIPIATSAVPSEGLSLTEVYKSKKTFI
jgi:hypothetical protein